MTWAAIWKANVILNEYLDRWLERAVERMRAKMFGNYQGMLHTGRSDPFFGERVLAALRLLDLQAVYQQMTK